MKVGASQIQEHSLQETLLRALFHHWRAVELPYAVLRNYEEFPQRMRKPDLGILIDPLHTLQLIESTQQVANELGLGFFTRYHSPSILSLFFLLWEKTEEGWEQKSIKIDARLYESMKFLPESHRVPGYNYKVFYENVVTHEIEQDGCRFRVLSPPDLFIFLIHHWRRKKEPRHFDQIQQLLKLEDVKGWADTVLGENWQPILNQVGSHKYDMMLQRLIESHWGKWSWTMFLRMQLKAARSYLTRPMKWFGPIFYFSGPDGSGKTTGIEAVKWLLAKNKISYVHFYTLHKCFRYVGLFFCWIADRIKGKRLSFKEFRGSLSGHRDRDEGNLGWRLKKRMSLLISFIDVWIGWFLALVYRMRGEVVLVETSPFDLFVKYHMPKFVKLEKWLVPLLPQPTKLFLFKANPSVILERKKELEQDEIANYYQRMEEILRGNIVIISTACLQEETERNLFSEVLGE